MGINETPWESREQGVPEEPKYPNTEGTQKSPDIKITVLQIEDVFDGELWYQAIYRVEYTNNPEERKRYKEELEKKYEELAEKLGDLPFLLIGNRYLIQPIEGDKTHISLKDFGHLRAQAIIHWRNFLEGATPRELMGTKFTMTVTEGEISMGVTFPKGSVLNTGNLHPLIPYKIAILGMWARKRMEDEELNEYEIYLGSYTEGGMHRDEVVLQVTRQGKEYELKVVMR